MDSKKIRQKFLEFFEKRGHKIVPSSSLIPTDPSVLLTTAGMQQFKLYYTEEKDPMADFGSRRTCSVQKSFRTSDIDQVGDESHLTFFEMLGNFSFAASAEASGEGGDNPDNFGKNGYFKRAAIFWAHEFITKEMGLKIDYVSIFGGVPSTGSDQEIPRDDESEKIWREIDLNLKIKEFGKKDNFWGPTGKEGPCGPTTEIYVNGVEIWNIVFNEYYCRPRADLAAETPAGAFLKLENPGVDTGMGLERLAMVLQKKNSVFETDLFEQILSIIGHPTSSSPSQAKPTGGTSDVQTARIIADHLRGSFFLIEDGVLPSNKEAGYVLRRLLRRVIRYEKIYSFDEKFYKNILEKVIEIYGGFYEFNKEKILAVLLEERERFLKTLERGLKEFQKIKPGGITGEEAFYLYETFGFPFDLTRDLAGESGVKISEEEFQKALEKHQEISRAGAEKKFGGHGIEKSNLKSQISKLTRLHTATHLLLAALRVVLGPVAHERRGEEEIEQKGSDINEERTRFDFNFSRKLTSEEIKKIEEIVNAKIKENLEISFEEMTLEEAKKIGAAGVFEHKYGEKVRVYSIGGPSLGSGQVFSKEICAGPHVKNTGEIGQFKIVKEESVSAGIRRLRAVID